CTPAAVTAFTALVTSCCRNAEGARAMGATENSAYRQSSSVPPSQAGRYYCWLHRAPRHDRVSGHDRARDRREKIRPQLDDLLSRAPSDLDQASGRHDNGAMASGGDQRKPSRQQEHDVTGRQHWPSNAVSPLRPRRPRKRVSALSMARLAIAAHQTAPSARVRRPPTAAGSSYFCLSSNTVALSPFSLFQRLH